MNTVGAIIQDPLDFPDDPLPATSIFEFREYAKPFELWEPDEFQEADGLYQPLHFALDVTEAQHQVLLKYQDAISQELLQCGKALIDFYQANPKPAKVRRSKKEAEKTEITKVRSEWDQKLLDLEAQLKHGMVVQGFPKRLAVTIISEAQGKIKAAHKIAERGLKLAKLKHQTNPSNHTHIKLQSWAAKQNYQGICFGKKRSLAVRQRTQQQMDALRLEQATDATVKRLLELEVIRSNADADWKVSRKFPVQCYGDAGGHWLNKTIYLQSVASGETELVIKLPKFLGPPQKGNQLPMMAITVTLSKRAQAHWEKALKQRAPLTFAIMPQRGLRWRATGVFKEPLVAKAPVLKGKRIGIDQNAGFITVSCVDGPKLRWVRKFSISQKGSREEQEARLYLVMAQVGELAKLEQAIVVIEDLRLVDKHKQFRSKRLRRKIQRIPYGLLQEVLGRVSGRMGIKVRKVNPAYTSILGRYRLPGMQVHLAAAAMIAWRDLGLADLTQATIFQVGEACLKIQGEDSPIMVEVKEGMPHVQRNVSDPRFMAALYRHVMIVIALTSHACKEGCTDGTRETGDTTVRDNPHGREFHAVRRGRSTIHDQTCPAAGTSSKVSIIVRPKPSFPRTKKSTPKTSSVSA